jgi:predicted negative regulator of RcsB-dependent stress response
VELYDSEEQQVEAIKEWWKENGKAVILGGVIGLGGLFGWQYYQDSVTAAKEEASQAYSQAIEKLTANGAEESAYVEGFISEHKDSGYAVLAALQLAKAQIDAGQLDGALNQLNWAKTNSDDESLAPLIAFRTARVLAEKGDLDSALSELTAIKAESWVGRVAELKGDLLLRQGDKDGAYSAYTEAQQANDASRTLQMKLDDLAR